LNKVSSIAVDHGVDDLPLWRDPQAYATVSALLQQHGVSEEQLARLVAAYRDHAHKQRARGLNDDFDAILMAEVE
jgi:hypothetical protein